MFPFDSRRFLLFLLHICAFVGLCVFLNGFDVEVFACWRPLKHLHTFWNAFAMTNWLNAARGVYVCLTKLYSIHNDNDLL